MRTALVVALSCSACGRPEARPWRQATAASGSAAGRRYTLIRCGSCGTESLGDAVELGPLYEGGTYAAPAGLLDRVLEPLRRLFDQERLRILGPISPGQKVIEVGAGRGRLLRSLQKRGLHTTGIEPSAVLARAAEARGVEVQQVGIEAASFPAGRFDLVVFWHVLEHLERPDVALARARSWLAPDGRVVIAVPNRESLQARLGGDRWFHQDVPRHRTQFTLSGLRALLERSGFRETGARHLMAQQNMLGMWLTLLNSLTSERDVPFRLLKRDLRYQRRVDLVRDAAVSATAGLLLVPVAIAFEFLAGLARRGGTVVVQARPRVR